MIRNVRRGLVTRTSIIKLLDSTTWITTSDISKQVDVTSHTVLYHLRNLEREKVVERNAEGRRSHDEVGQILSMIVFITL